MQVRLKQDWFGPDAHLYQRAPNGGITIVPDRLRDVLPRFAVIVGENGEPEPEPIPEAPQPSLRDLDLDRVAGDAQEAALAKAETFRAQALASAKKRS